MLTSLLNSPDFMLGLLIGVLLGCVGLLLTLLAFDAVEDRSVGKRASHTPPVRKPPAGAWGTDPHGRGARSVMRSGPR